MGGRAGRVYGRYMRSDMGMGGLGVAANVNQSSSARDGAVDQNVCDNTHSESPENRTRPGATEKIMHVV